MKTLKHIRIVSALPFALLAVMSLVLAEFISGESMIITSDH